MRTVILFAIAFSILTGIVYSQTAWEILNSGVTADLRAVCFTDINTGYVCGTNGTILKTTNAGLNWNPLNASVSGTLNDICFADVTTGFCGGNMGILKTTNSGQNWSSISTTPANKIACREGILYSATMNSVDKSTNSGANWTNVMAPGVAVHGIYFVNGNTGYANGYNGLHRKTTNGGLNWQQGGAWFPGTYTFSECFFPVSGPGVVACSYNSGWPNYFTNNVIYKADFVGGSWSSAYSNSNNGLNGISFGSNDTGFCVGGNYSGQSLILKSIDAGNSWTQLIITITQVLLLDAYFINSTTGYITGVNGTIIKTSTGGITGVQSVNGSTPITFSLSQNYPNPFNPTTKIRFEISGSSAAQTFLSVYDILGREVATLVNEELKPGIYEADWKASDFPSGVYFYKFETEYFTETKRMILLK